VAEDSSGIQYSDAPPTVTGKTSDGNPKSHSGSGGGNGESDQSSTRSGSKADGKSDDRDSDDKGGAGGGSDDGGKGGAAGKKAGEEKAGNGATPIDHNLAASSEDDDSSPLVPILIALAVLAAISVGVVAMRRKREDADPGAPASHEAG
jgi:cobalamin biosynthesis Mg chelatase CobN